MTSQKRDIARVEAVKSAHQDELMRKANVVGVGVGLRQRGGQRSDEVVLVVLVDRKLAAETLDPSDLIPAEIDGVPVDVQQVGEISVQT